MRPGENKPKTPVQDLIEKVSAVEKWARTEDERMQLGMVLQQLEMARKEEREHIEEAWRNGSDGIKYQSAAQYFENTYGK